MKQTLLVAFSLFLIGHLRAQVGPTEFMAGDKYLHYQHSFGQQLKPASRFGWQHIATLIKRYNTDTEKKGMPDELMNQAYITARINNLLSLKGGVFYTNVGGYQPTLGLQLFMHKKDWIIVVAPRTDIVKNGSYEVFAMVEFSPSSSKSTRLYTRLQAMSNANKEYHNRSYQMIRVGLDVKGFRIGGGLTLDEYGTSDKIHYNTGVFIRRML
ncbi:MAG TPA: hypothetical protein VEZ55_12665 [Chitinophagaceae bacterium]|nr:hypothetical protein [Chitinophagaceae bacterium]